MEALFVGRSINMQFGGMQLLDHTTMDAVMSFPDGKLCGAGDRRPRRKGRDFG
jgi:hypothetical protein